MCGETTSYILYVSIGQGSEKSFFKVFVSTFLCIPKTLLDVFSDLL